MPKRVVAVLTGAKSYGFNPMEIATAVRHRAPPLIVVTSNGDWAIGVREQ